MRRRRTAPAGWDTAHDEPEAAIEKASANEDSAERKKAAKKAKRDAEKAEADRKAALAKQPQPKADDSGETKKEDPDPQGLELVKTKQPLDEAMKYLNHLLELSPRNIECQLAGFEVYLRRGKITSPCQPFDTSC